MKGLKSMIINAETLKSLKQINVSADKEKTMSRVKLLWAETPPSVKKKVLGSIKTGDATIYRIFRTGAITPRIVLALASSLNSNPFYLTGDVDENEGYNPEIPELFLEAKGIDIRQRGKKGAPDHFASLAEDSQAAFPTAEFDAVQEDLAYTPAEKADVSADVGEDEYVLQLRALFHRAAFSSGAKTKLASIAGILFME